VVGKRFAFTMIELIFAIVVIAITVLALPTMNQVISKGVESNLVQEAIFAAATQLNQATTYFWDENSTVEDNTSYARVIWMSDDDCNDITKLRPGHINQELHRRCNNDKTIRPTYTSDDNINDLDDANQSNAELFLGDPSATGYKKDYLMDVTIDEVNSSNGVTFGEETNETVEKNLKRVRVTIKDKDTNDVITQLDAYAPNIGEIDYFHRSFE